MITNLLLSLLLTSQTASNNTVSQQEDESAFLDALDASILAHQKRLEALKQGKVEPSSFSISKPSWAFGEMPWLETDLDRRYFASCDISSCTLQYRNPYDNNVVDPFDDYEVVQNGMDKAEKW
jgi:hypothetical protein